MWGASSAMNVFEADRARDWQEAFYKKRHRWQVKDLQKAGINPMLYYNKGGAAPGVPAGAVARVGGYDPATGSQAASARGIRGAQARLAEAHADIAGYDKATAHARSVLEGQRARYADVLAKEEALQRREAVQQAIAHTDYWDASSYNQLQQGRAAAAQASIWEEVGPGLGAAAKVAPAVAAAIPVLRGAKTLTRLNRARRGLGKRIRPGDFKEGVWDRLERRRKERWR